MPNQTPRTFVDALARNRAWLHALETYQNVTTGRPTPEPPRPVCVVELEASGA